MAVQGVRVIRVFMNPEKFSVAAQRSLVLNHNGKIGVKTPQKAKGSDPVCEGEGVCEGV